MFQLYEPLVGINAAAQPYLLLAEEIEPNKTATAWTIRIKKGIEPWFYGVAAILIFLDLTVVYYDDRYMAMTVVCAI